MNKKYRRILIICIIIMIISLLCIIALNVIKPQNKDKGTGDKTPAPQETEQSEFLEPEDSPADENQKYVTANAEKLNAYLLDSTKTVEDYEKLTGLGKEYFLVIVGKNSDEGYGIPKEYRNKIKTNDIKEYEEQHKIYLENLEKQIISNYSFELTGKPKYTQDKKQLVQFLNISPYNYSLYQRDLAGLQEELLKMANITEFKENVESITNIYKAKIKAMEILDAELDNYNSNEIYETALIYDIDKEITCNISCSEYVTYAIGEYTAELKINESGDSVYENNKSARIQNIIQNAITNNILDQTNPLKLK